VFNQASSKYELMNRVIFFGIGVLSSGLCFAGDVMYTLWEDDQSQVWITIENNMDRTIHIESISLAFYDRKGRPTEEQLQECEKNCKLHPKDATDFGPFRPPQIQIPQEYVL